MPSARPLSVAPEPARASGRAPAAALTGRFDALYDAHHDSVWRVARLLGVPDAHVDDVVHDVFLIAHRRLDRLDPERPARAWLHGIARNVVMHHRRSHARHQRRLEVVPPPTGTPSPDEVVARREAGAFMERFLAELSPAHAEVFVLFEIEEMSGKEIAEATGAPMGTVFSRLRLARRRFAAAVAELDPEAQS